MPTGTGKTGVIAVLSAGVPPEGWTLILTPWKNLCDQMVRQIREQFWTDRGWTPPEQPTVERLYPSTLEEVVVSEKPRLIIVATFATLVAISDLS
jgi:superfamily II DNA or RNA helicase